MEKHKWMEIASQSELTLLTCSQITPFAFAQMLDDYYSVGTPFLGLFDPEDYYAFERMCHYHSEGKYLPKGSTAYTRYFLCDSEGTIYAQGDVRHAKNHEQTYFSGYVGYGVLPSRRQCGYGTVMCAKLVEKAAVYHPEVIITCREDNLPSQKIIIKNGGALLDIRYWKERNSIMRRYGVKTT